MWFACERKMRFQSDKHRVPDTGDPTFVIWKTSAKQTGCPHAVRSENPGSQALAVTALEPKNRAWGRHVCSGNVGEHYGNFHKRSLRYCKGLKFQLPSTKMASRLVSYL